MIKTKYHPYEEQQKKGYKEFMKTKKKRKAQSTHRNKELLTLDNFPYGDVEAELAKIKMSKKLSYLS